MPMKRSSSPECSGSRNIDTGALEDAFDVSSGKAMFLTLLAIARVPIELQAIDLHRA
jgi:hypothetical protein